MLLFDRSSLSGGFEEEQYQKVADIRVSMNILSPCIGDQRHHHATQSKETCNHNRNRENTYTTGRLDGGDIDWYFRAIFSIVKRAPGPEPGKCFWA